MNALTARQTVQNVTITGDIYSWTAAGCGFTMESTTTLVC